MIWEKLTHPEFSVLNRTIPVVINVAAVEQHGPHLPVDVDCRIGQHFCDRIDAAMRDKILILPQIKVCCSQHHMDFPGTLTVSHTTFLAYLSDILESVVAHGFKHIFILNSHGGNQAIGRVTVESFGPKVIAVGGQLAFASWWDVASNDLAKLNVSGPNGVGHACEFETSLMQLIAPEAVKESEIGGMSYDSYMPWADGDLLRAPAVSVYRSMKSISGGSGTVGDPSFASAEKGQEISDLVTTRLVQILTDLGLGTTD